MKAHYIVRYIWGDNINASSRRASENGRAIHFSYLCSVWIKETIVSD